MSWFGDCGFGVVYWLLCCALVLVLFDFVWCFVGVCWFLIVTFD